MATAVAPRAGKMNQIACCDWLPERARWSARDYPLYPASKISPKAIYKSFIDQVCSDKMAGYWPRFFFCEFIDLDFVINTQKKNLANIQPS